MSESEQLMRDAPSVRYDPRFNEKCLLGGIDNAREFLAYLVGMLTQIKRMHSVPIYQTALFRLFWLTLPM